MLENLIIIENFIKIEYIITFIILILPGFIGMKAIKLKVPTRDLLLKDTLYEVLSYSLLNLVLIGWLPYLSIKYEWAIAWQIILLFFSIIIFPILLAFVYLTFIESKYFKKNFNIQTKTAWDWYFSQKPNCTVLIKFKNGSEVIAHFGEKSYATSYPDECSIYLEKLYRYNDENKLETIPDSAGIIISKDELDTIEFYKTTK